MGDENLQTIAQDDNLDAGQLTQGAGEKTPEDTPRDLGDVVRAQETTISELVNHIESLNSQISKLVRSAGVPSDTQPPEPTLPDNPVDREGYVYLKDLGREMGKGDRT